MTFIIKKIIIASNQIITQDFFYNRGQIQRATEELFVPWSLTDLLRIALAKLVGSGWLHPNLAGLHFWRSWPNKYQTVRNYERSKVNIIILH